MVARGLAREDDFRVQEAAMVAWRKLGLDSLDDDALSLAERSPFDGIRYLARPDADVSDLRTRFGLSMHDAREPNDYCARGTPVDDRAQAVDLARSLGIPDRQETPYGISAGAVSASYKQGNMTYFAYDRGEFGGGLIRVSPDGSQDVAYQGNVTFIAPVSATAQTGPAWVFAGLNHMMSQGSLQRLDDGVVSFVTTLPSAVVGLAQEGDDYILSFHRAEAEPKRWQSSQTPLRLSPDGTLSPACPRAN